MYVVLAILHSTGVPAKPRRKQKTLTSWETKIAGPTFVRPFFILNPLRVEADSLGGRWRTEILQSHLFAVLTERISAFPALATCTD